MLPLLERGHNSFVRSYPARRPRGCPLDKMKVRQVLLNLLSNAAKFTEPRADRARGHPRAGAEPADGEQVVLRVSDTGIGMSAEQIKRIFEEYAQGSAATTRRYGGTGLGLAISRSFCQRMRGDIEVASGLGEGSIFTVHLPAQLGPGGRAGARQLGPTSATRTASVRPGCRAIIGASGRRRGERGRATKPASSLRSGVFPWPV